MSMKKFFIALLAMILCFSMLLTACGNDAKKDKDDDKDDDAKSSTEEKQLIIDKIAGFDIMNAIDTALSNINVGDANTMIGEVFDTINNTNAEADLDISFNDQTADMYFGFKDNRFQGSVTVNGETEDAYALIKDTGIFMFSQYENGSFQVEGMTGFMDDITGADMSDFEAEIDSVLTPDVKNVLSEFRFPELTKNDLTKDGDFYYINSSYYSKAAEQILNLIVDVMKASGATADVPTGAEFDSMLAMVNGVIEALNLKIGFAAGDSEICGFAISADVDINELMTYFEGDVEEETPMPASEMKQTAKVSLEALSTADLKAPKYIHFDMNVAVDDIEVSASAKLDAILKNKNEIKGATIDASVDIKNISVAYESEYNEIKESYIATQVYGDMNISLKGTVDFSDSEKAGAKIVDLKFAIDGTPTRHETYDEMTGEPVTKIVDLDSYAIKVDVTADMTVKSKGSASVNVDVDATAEGETVEAAVTGTVNWLSAPNFKGLPASVEAVMSTDFADVYEQALRNAEAKRAEVYNPNVAYDDWSSFLWYDSSTGFYIVLTGEYEGNTQVFINTPPEYCYNGQVY